MTIDHLGAVLYPELRILRIVGRISFPLFTYLLTLGVESTSNLKNYFIRLFAFGIISQIPYHFALGYEPLESLNIFFTLTLGLLVLADLKLMMIPLLASLVINFDYGSYGFMLIACMNQARCL